MNIQEAAAQSGLTADTIRFYERKGILPQPPRQANGYRKYTADHVSTLRLAKGLRHLAVPLEAVAPMIAVAHSGTCGEVRSDLAGALSEALAETEQRLGELMHVRDHLKLILAGLTAMDSADIAIPGMAPCECIRFVSDAAEE